MECRTYFTDYDIHIYDTQYDAEQQMENPGSFIKYDNLANSCSSSKVTELVSPSIGNFQHEHIREGGNASLCKWMPSLPVKDISVENPNINAGNRQLNQNENKRVESHIGSRTYNCVSIAAENLVNGITYDSCHESLHTGGNKTNGSRCYDYIPHNAEAQVDGVSPSCSDIDILLRLPQEIESTKTIDALQGINFNTHSLLQSEGNIAFCNVTPVDSLASKSLADDLPDIDFSTISPLEVISIPSKLEEQNHLPVDVYNQPSPSQPVIRPPHIEWNNLKLQEESSELEFRNDPLSSKNEKVKKRLHEVEEPFEDTKREKKRRDAIRAKRTRERRKNDIKTLEDQLNSLKQIRDSLMDDVSQLKVKEDNLEKTLRKYQIKFGSEAEKEA